MCSTVFFFEKEELRKSIMFSGFELAFVVVFSYGSFDFSLKDAFRDRVASGLGDASFDSI